MRVRVIAVGTRMPGWVDTACEDYRRRLREPWRLLLTEIAAPRREGGATAAARARSSEARGILSHLGRDDFVVALDEQGSQPSTQELASWLSQRARVDESPVFVIGGPDGLDAAVLERARLIWSLSRLTLPHALARVVLFEQLYRAVTVLIGHPYHRA